MTSEVQTPELSLNDLDTVVGGAVSEASDVINCRKAGGDGNPYAPTSDIIVVC